MCLLLLVLQTYILYWNVNNLNGYVLFAANVEDFQRIAKKLGSENFMDQIVELASNPAVARFKNKINDDTEFYQQSRVHEKGLRVNRQNGPKSRGAMKTDGSELDFDELVERVKQRLEKEFNDKYKIRIVSDNAKSSIANNYKTKHTTSKSQQRPKKRFVKKNHVIKSTLKISKLPPINDGYDYEDVDDSDNGKVNKFEPHKETSYSKPKTTKKAKDVSKYETQNNKMYYDNVYETGADEIDKDSNLNRKDNGLIYEKIEIVKDDSYGDYVTPEKESKIFASDERTERTTLRNRYRVTDRERIKKKLETVNSDILEDENTEAIGSVEIKARTEKLWIEDNDYDNDTIIVSDERRNKAQGTGVPTREMYSMVTPNYYASLPTIAEKYDFNEPIPERDRERERIKYIGNPPALINKKIKLIK